MTGDGVLRTSDALDTIVELGPGRCSDGSVAAAHRLRVQLDERLRRGEGLTVAALAGGTGVGKSALVNALVGRQVAREGVRRPTTSVALAVVGHHDGQSAALLDWLDVPRREEVGTALPDGLILLDLPDHDSVAETHRLTATRLARRVDALIWVLDPLKYARVDAHEGLLAELTRHAEVLVVVLNRSDELDEAGLGACLQDLRHRLEAGGHRQVTVLATSAVTGHGIAELAALLRHLVEQRDAAERRLTADAAVLGERMLRMWEELPDAHVEAEALLPAVLEVTDSYRTVEEAAQRYRFEARSAARSPLARIVRAPLVVWSRTAAGMGLVRAPGRPQASTVTAARAEAVLVRAFEVGRAAGRAHGSLDRSVSFAAAAAAPELLDAVATAGVDPGHRRWWSLLAALRGSVEAGLVGGLTWLVAIGVVDWLQLPQLPLPDLAPGLPWPTALVLIGLVIRGVLALVSRSAISAGARRHARGVETEIRRRLLELVDGRLLAPVRAELAVHRRLHEALDTLAGRVGEPRTTS